MKPFIPFLLLLFSVLGSTNSQAQTNASPSELKTFFNNNQILLTYREGEVLYGTYYFITIHYCPNGYYGLYGNSVKRTVMGNEQKNNWQEFGTWEITTQQGLNGILYKAQNGGQSFYPMYKLANGDFYVSEGITIVKQGLAICR